MADIKCPVCGQMNPDTNEMCSNCLTQLHMGTDALRDLGKKPIQPGQVPTKKTTSELEPILPQWLKDARSGDRPNTANKAPTGDLPLPNASRPAASSPTPSKPVSSDVPDLLAGLQAQSDGGDEEDVPSWLTGATGIQPKKKSTGQIGTRRVELGGNTGQLPPIKNQSESAATPRITATQAPAEKRGGTGELPPWLAETMAKDPLAPPVSETPSWLPPSQAESTQNADPFGAGMTNAGESDAFTQGGGLDWLSNLQSASDAPAANEPVREEAAFGGEDLPPWLQNSSDSSSMPPEASTSSTPAISAMSFPSADTPDWLSNLGESGSNTATPQEKISGGDWLNSFESAPAPSSSAFTDQSASSDTPDWLSSLGGSDSSASVAPEAASSGADWLNSFETPAAPTPTAFTEEPSADTPDWLSNLGAPSESPVPPVSKPVSTPSTTSAFSEDVFAAPDWLNNLGTESTPALAAGNTNSLFTETPDWLANVEGGNPVVPSPDSKSKSNSPPSNAAPADLPAWVQAMRPVDTTPLSKANIKSGGVSDAAGPLAGLQGVLPSMPFMPTSKPRAYSIKLQVTDEHQTHSSLMEQIIESETTPEPIISMERVVSQRWLRRSLFGLFAVLILGLLYARTQLFMMPVSVPVEAVSAMTVAESIPENSQVLVVFDYDPALIGEMEAISVPLVDHMIVLKHPRLAFISTSPLGEALAERFSSGLLAQRTYQRGAQYVNLGYLPGGLAGVRAFAENPLSAVPQANLWSSPALAGLTSINQFAAIVVITDDVDAGRVWVEQTNGLRGSAPVLLAASAQAAPMFYPYYHSGQIAGMINGLHGAAVAEQRNAGLPGTSRHYWDSYALSMILSVLLIGVGGLWNLFAGMNARRAEAR